MIRLALGAELDDATRAALASGAAEPSVMLFIDAVLAMRGHDASVTEDAALAGATLEAEAPVAMADDALARVMAVIDALPAQPPRKSYEEVIRMPARVRDAVRAAEQGKGWEYAGPGISSLTLMSDGPIRAQVLRIAPGAGTPRHSHAGREVTLCMVGGFSDALGSYGPGDIAMTDPSITHQPVADQDGPCFVLALTDAGLRFTGLFGAIQRVLGKRP